MVVAGAPEKTKYHAHNICDMALDMVRSIDHLKDPSNGNNIQIRVGLQSPDLLKHSYKELKPAVYATEE